MTITASRETKLGPAVSSAACQRTVVQELLQVVRVPGQLKDEGGASDLLRDAFIKQLHILVHPYYAGFLIDLQIQKKPPKKTVASLTRKVTVGVPLVYKLFTLKILRIKMMSSKKMNQSQEREQSVFSINYSLCYKC